MHPRECPGPRAARSGVTGAARLRGSAPARARAANRRCRPRLGARSTAEALVSRASNIPENLSWPLHFPPVREALHVADLQDRSEPAQRPEPSGRAEQARP